MKKVNQLHRLQVPCDAAGQRLDQFVAARLSGLSRSLCRQIIDLGGVHVDGRRTRKCSLPVQSGQHLEVHLDGLPLEPFSLKEGHILYRDRHILVVDKPAGVNTQPTPARYKGTLYEAVLSYLQDPFRPQLRPHLGMIQRLDRDTSGVLVFSTHPQAHKPLSEAVTQRRLTKVYLALVEGVPKSEQGEISSCLARSRRNNLMKSVAQGGRDARTLYRVLRAWEGSSLLEVRLVTGRSHQIRVHLAEAGHPLLGDTAYGGPERFAGHLVPRQMLHAYCLGLKHPVSGAFLKFYAPVPEDMQQLLKLLGEDNPEALCPIIEDDPLC